MHISPATKKVAVIYGAWALLCVFFAAIGLGDHKAGHIYLAVTGLPLALLSFHIIPNGSVFATFVAGVIGWVQWCLVAEANSRWETWRKSKHGT